MRRTIWLILALLLAGSAQPSAQVRAQLPPEQIPLFDTRVDIEVVADSLFGVERPPGWKGSTDTAALSFVIDLWVDNELLANAIFGDGIRPSTWIGVGTGTPEPRLLARSVRHDLELSADQYFGIGVRPDTWRGAPPLERCALSLRGLVEMLNRFEGFDSNTPESALDFCRTLLVELEPQLTELLFRPDASGSRPDAVALLASARGDLERMADELLGLDVRPEGYLMPPNREPATLSFKADFARDLTILTDDQLGFDQRPAGWLAIDPPPVDDFIAALFFRRNLELLADTALGARFGAGFRPTGWQAEGLTRCDPTTQALVVLTTENYGFDIGAVDLTTPGYCAQLEIQLVNLVDSPPIIDVVDTPQERRLQAESNFAFAYLDVGATQYMGIMPGGVEFRAVYRNFGQSRMMLVTSEQFSVYIDYRFTSLPEEIFSNLPTLDGVAPVTFCDDFWCSGPGPTPTPTGAGPLLSVLIGSEPIATPDTSTIATTKRLVSWEFIRVTYISDNLGTRTAQVALEICPSRPQTSLEGCESVVSIFDNATGVPRPIVSQSNGLNVFEVAYGYTPNIVLEGTTLYSTDIWISDPTIR
jgi:hypothetical protein